MSKKDNMINFTMKAYDRCETNMHANTIVVNNKHEPRDYVIQRHLDNMCATYGREFVAEVIANMSLDQHQTKKVG